MAVSKGTSAKTSRTQGSGDVWTEEERAAMQASVRERKKAARLTPEEERAAGERDVLAQIAAMPEPDHGIAERIYAIVAANAPSLVPRTFYGMPAWARDGKTVCFFKPASKFKERYASFGFEQVAHLDEGSMWATSWALTALTAEDEARIAELVKKAVS